MFGFHPTQVPSCVPGWLPRDGPAPRVHREFRCRVRLARVRGLLAAAAAAAATAAAAVVVVVIVVVAVNDRKDEPAPHHELRDTPPYVQVCCGTII